MTCRRDRLPSGVPNQYLHKNKTDTKARSKAARFNHPINMVKVVPAVGFLKAYHRIHTPLQLTSLCNISTVNALNKCVFWLRKKEFWTGKSKRVWGIEINSARNLYLQSYYCIDCMDHMIKILRLFYRSWKYWHSPMLHREAMVVVVAYDMYLEVS